MSDEKAERQVRAARNQALFRVVNERLEGLADAFQFIAEHTAFTCECADERCVEPMLMTVDEYETMRGHSNRFAVLRGTSTPRSKTRSGRRSDSSSWRRSGPARTSPSGPTRAPEAGNPST